jgi:hypothetical protein
MIRIAITPAFEAIALTLPLPLGSVEYENELSPKGERLIWLEARVVDRLATMRGPGESFSEAIIKLLEMEGACAR